MLGSKKLPPGGSGKLAHLSQKVTEQNDGQTSRATLARNPTTVPWYRQYAMPSTPTREDGTSNGCEEPRCRDSSIWHHNVRMCHDKYVKDGEWGERGTFKLLDVCRC